MRIAVVFLLLSMIILGSCTEDDSILKPYHITAVTDALDYRYMDEGPALSAVQITNKDNVPLAGVNVTFTLKKGAAELSAESMATDANGVAYTHVTFNPETDTVELEVTTRDVEKLLFNYYLSDSRATQINITWGNNQQGVAGEFANAALIVVVTDDFGYKPVGVPVKFAVLEGNGRVSREIADTNDYGQAEVAFTMSDTTVVNTVAAILGTDSVFFTLESIYPSKISLKPSIDRVEVIWEKSHATQFQGYTLFRTGPDGIARELAYHHDVNDTVFTDTGSVGDGLAGGFTYTYKLVVRTEKTFVESTAGVVFGERIFLEANAVDFEVDESRNQLYVSLPTLNEVHVFDLLTHKLKEKIKVGSKPYGLSLSHDKSTLYIALFGSGDVAFLNLTTKQIIKVDVDGALGDLKAFDVIEGAPGRVFVTGSPEQYGSAYITVIKTDENNKVERFMQNTVRFQPALAVDYGKFIYVINGTGLYKLDPYGVYTDFSQQPDYVSTFEQKHLVINPSGTKLYLDFEVVNTNPVYTVGQVGVRVPALSPDGSIVHYYNYSVIRSYNATTLQEIKKTFIASNGLRKLELTSDNSTFIALSIDYASAGDIIYFIPNK